jgi:hydroxyacylglutathione hydrolase
MFAVEAFPATELGNASFLLVDQDHGVGLVVDPYRDVDAYLTRAEALGIKLTHALDTHLHNDFASGRGELEAETGTAIGELDAGQELAFGGLSLRARQRPGQRPER